MKIPKIPTWIAKLLFEIATRYVESRTPTGEMRKVK
jgi:hypothetical protein